MKENNRTLFAKLLPQLSLSLCAAYFLPAIALLPSTALAASAALENLPNFTALVEQSGPAVVNISTTRTLQRASSAEQEELLKRYFGEPHPQQNEKPPEPPQSSEQEISHDVGSGFIFSADGYLLTNAHVVKDADEVWVKLSDKREFQASIVGIDENTDIAVLKIKGDNLPKVTIGDSRTISVGEWVIAIGSPFDLENSISAGIVSAKAREIGDFLLLIQTDVAINPGNSGGPLINMKGEVIGINSQIYSRSGGYMGISFAIPIDDAMRVAEQLQTQGRVTRGRMGIYLADVSGDVATALKLPTATGALVSRIEPEGPAQKAGILDGDIILKFNDNPIEKSTELRRLAAATAPNSKVNLTLWRKGIVKTQAITLGEQPRPPARISKTAAKSPQGNADNHLGLQVKSLTAQQKKELGINSGVVVERAEGLASTAGLQAGDIIFTLNNQDVQDEKEFKTLTAKLDLKKTAVILAKREQITQYIAIKTTVAKTEVNPVTSTQ